MMRFGREGGLIVRFRDRQVALRIIGGIHGQRAAAGKSCSGHDGEHHMSRGHGRTLSLLLIGQLQQMELRELALAVPVVARDVEIAHVVLDSQHVERGNRRDDEEDHAGKGEPEPGIRIGERGLRQLRQTEGHSVGHAGLCHMDGGLGGRSVVIGIRVREQLLDRVVAIADASIRCSCVAEVAPAMLL